MEAVVEYLKHSGIIINKAFSSNYFPFSTIDKTNTVCLINKLKSKNSTQENDILIRILKENGDFSAEYIYVLFNQPTEISKCPSLLKIIFCLFSKKLLKTRKRITESLIYYRYFLQYLKRF